jgi:hypothetical protein
MNGTLISKLRKRWSEFFERIRKSGRVVADAERLAALERDGLLLVARSQMPSELYQERLRGSYAGVLEALLQERGAGR